jgi:hypothetical protein
MKHYNQDDIDTVKTKFKSIKDSLNEKQRRLWCASEAIAFGCGGLSLVSAATGLSGNTIRKAIDEIKNGDASAQVRIRCSGGGRKKATEKQRGLRKALKMLVDSETKGDPETPLLWTSKSTRHLSEELKNQGYKISHSTVSTLLQKYGYSLQVNKKTLEGTSHVDRDAQFKHINDSINNLQKQGQPTISVDTKKKENIGNFKNGGAELCKKGTPIKVNDHDFPDKKLGKVVPFGVYDIGKNNGWVSVGISADTAEFAVNAIRTWWYKMGKTQYPAATELLITADCGGSNGYRVRLWKVELNNLADETGLKIHVRHFPPGTSKWNKIEHRLFSYISKNWRGKPLISREVVVNLISNTKTSRGLKVMAVLDENDYQKGKGDEISDTEIASINICGDDFHPEWNYTISPRKNNTQDIS